jgi:hypothetical protein
VNEVTCIFSRIFIQIFQEYQEYLDEDESELDNILDDNAHICSLLAELVNEVVATQTKVLKVKCAAHSLQLVIWDGLKESDVNNLIKVCRIAIKLLRKPKMTNYMRDMGMSVIVPKYDCVTRWGATYLMVRVNKRKIVLSKTQRVKTIY